MKDAPRTIDYLDGECEEHFVKLQGLLTELDIPYEIDTGIVRGLDYYTRTVFEFVNSEGFTLCGGDIPSVGFGIGIERILYFLEREKVASVKPEPVALYVGILGEGAKAKAYQLVTTLRAAGVVTETDYLSRSVKAQMKYANKIGAKNTVILGADELAGNRAAVKNMETGEQTEVELDKLVEYIVGKI